MRTKTGPATIQDVTLLPLDPMRIVVRTEASMCCYSDTGRALGLPAAANGQGAFNQPTILGHGGIGIVEAVGAMVKRVQVGDRVMVPNTAQCGECYNCLRGRADQCLLNGQAPEPIARLADGTPVVQWNNEGGYSELMVPYENRVVSLFTRVPSTELAVLHCSGACGLGATMTLAPIEPASDVVIFGAGPLGLSAVQGARIKGAVQIIVVEPIRARRELALKVGPRRRSIRMPRATGWCRRFATCVEGGRTVPTPAAQTSAPTGCSRRWAATSSHRRRRRARTRPACSPCGRRGMSAHRLGT
jgi:S-(hydroxymethyl)glutathione dehydrogenase/alcohol dehydrogenase